MNWLDAFLLLAVIGGLAVGHIQRLWRQAMSLAAIICAVVLATYLHAFLAAWFRFIRPHIPAFTRDGLAFFLILIVLAAVLEVAQRRVYPETPMPALGIFDRAGGVFLGFFTICAQLGLLVLILRFYARLSWPIGNSIRLVLAQGLESSTLVPLFYQALILLLRIIGSLLPGGLPGFVTQV